MRASISVHKFDEAETSRALLSHHRFLKAFNEMSRCLISGKSVIEEQKLNCHEIKLCLGVITENKQSKLKQTANDPYPQPDSAGQIGIIRFSQTFPHFVQRTLKRLPKIVNQQRSMM